MNLAYNDYLQHHGIKGQKWGIRRYQNPDGTLTAEGRKRYGGDVNSKQIYDKVINMKLKGQDAVADIPEIRKMADIVSDSRKDIKNEYDSIDKSISKNIDSIDSKEAANKIIKNISKYTDNKYVYHENVFDEFEELVIDKFSNKYNKDIEKFSDDVENSFNDTKDLVRGLLGEYGNKPAYKYNTLFTTKTGDLNDLVSRSVEKLSNQQDKYFSGMWNINFVGILEEYTSKSNDKFFDKLTEIENILEKEGYYIYD